IQPVVGRKKPGDFRDEVIVEAYLALIANYFPQERVLLNVLPLEMRYAGPKEAVFHAILRKNYGCTHIVIGRDHAGVGDFYPSEAAIEIFEQFPDLGIRPVTIRGDFFYCYRCGGIASERNCPHSGDDVLPFCGTDIARMFRAGKTPPPEIMRPEVSAVVREANEPFVT
ncbi:MAG: sulfate adenylyltransferase, partial [Armatimonadota bacterium]